MSTELIFADVALIKGPGGELGVHTRQEIPDSVIEDMKERKAFNDSGPCGEYFHVGSVPDFLFLQWLREGYDARVEPVAATLKKLRAEASVFALTDRRI